jgi:tRNA1Val (adenine37-N6)-methyltransferase
MKVCTDACIFGAWFANKNLSADRILDIGSGTGLLMLMLAQMQKSIIEGIEIDSNCFQQLQENVSQSKWSERLVVRQGDIKTFRSELAYDFIISNPPFHENSLNSPSVESNLARHSAELNLDELIISIDQHLSSTGSFAVLLPYYRSEYFESIALKEKFHLTEKVSIRQSPNHKYFRSILHYSRTPQHQPSISELTIQNESREYTNEFVELLKDYYLYLQPD